jgi:4-amino-4-deoxy-L-arabinose transferase-like glycosyltransferase
MRLALAIVAAIALASLLPRSARLGLAGDYVDPVSRVTAQDEALYANTSIGLAREGGWLTPQFMGRYALYKPPLLYWLSAAAARVLGISTFALRLPIALIAALSGALLFLWAADLGGWAAGALALALLISNHLWHTLSGMAMTDGLLAAFFLAGFYVLFAHPWLDTKASLWGFSGAVAAAVLTKGIAGILPLAVLALYWVSAPSRYRPRLARVAVAGALAIALAAPWFVYQIAAHGKWFRTEHVDIEILGFGAGAPRQTSPESRVQFYGMRLALTDPMLLAAALVSIPGFVASLRRRDASAVLLACWIAVTAAAVFGWQYRNTAYLLPLVPALALLAGIYGPVVRRASATGVTALAVALVVSKAVTAAAPWGISLDGGTVQPLAPVLQDYCERTRSNELVLVGVDDDLYASALPLPRIHYALVGAPPPTAGPYSMDFAGMGIIVTADQFNHLPQWLPAFRDRLHQWGQNSTEAVATLIQIPSVADLAEVVRAHPESDFLLPDRYRSVTDSSHVLVEAFPDHCFLLARTSSPRHQRPPWTCRM